MAAFLFALAILGVSGVVMVRHAIAGRKRREAYVAVAQGMGWEYTKRDSDLVRPHGQLPLFRDRHPAENVLRGEFGSRPATIFEYTQGQGKSAVAQTIVHLQSATADLPVVELRPEIKFADSLFKSFGYQDIEIPDRPEFNRRYVLRGPDEAGIRARFSDAVLDFLESIPHTCVQAYGPHLFVYRMGHVVMPDTLPELLTLATEVLRIFEGNDVPSIPSASSPPLSA